MDKLLLAGAISHLLAQDSAYAQNNRDHRYGSSPEGGVAVGKAGSPPWYETGRGGGGRIPTKTTGVKPAPNQVEKPNFGTNARDDR